MFSGEVFDMMLNNLQKVGYSLDTVLQFANDSIHRDKNETALIYWELMQIKAG